MKTCILAFSGSIGSGKTTISKETSRVLHWSYGSFGDYIRKEALQRGVNPESREVLQEIGSELINQGWKEFCEAVLMDSGWEKGSGLVLDGIRHHEGLETIRGIVYPLPTFLIYVRVSENVRKRRLIDKKINLEHLGAIEQHSTEQQVKTNLKRYANLVLDSSRPLNDNINSILEWLSR